MDFFASSTLSTATALALLSTSAAYLFDGHLFCATCHFCIECGDCECEHHVEIRPQQLLPRERQM